VNEIPNTHPLSAVVEFSSHCATSSDRRSTGQVQNKLPLLTVCNTRFRFASGKHRKPLDPSPSFTSLYLLRSFSLPLNIFIHPGTLPRREHISAASAQSLRVSPTSSPTTGYRSLTHCSIKVNAGNAPTHAIVFLLLGDNRLWEFFSATHQHSRLSPWPPPSMIVSGDRRSEQSEPGIVRRHGYATTPELN
jgi:hypothetical protein